MDRSSPDLEEIFDKKLKAYASLDYKELKNPVDYYQNSIFVKQLEQQRALCSRNRASPTLFFPKGRSPSPTVLSSINVNNPNLVNRQYRRTRSDLLVPSPSSQCELQNGDLGFALSSNNVGVLNSVASNGIANLSGSYSRPSTPCESSISPKRLGSPFLRSKILANRDKESLMDEIIDLKKALLDQSAVLKRQRVISSNLEQENRKLEKELEDLACQGNNTTCASKQGNTPYDSRIRSRVQGLKSRVSQLEATCEIQQEELQLLRRDVRVTRTRELEAERDVFVDEVERLQQHVDKLKVAQNRLLCENKHLWRYKDRTTQLEAANLRLEKSSNELQKSLEKINKEVHESSRRGNENMIRAKRAEKQCQDLEEQSSVLKKLVEKEKSEKLKLQQMIHALQDQIQNLEASISSKSKLQSSTSSDQNQHEPGILAKTWGFLHTGPFHTKARELDTREFEKVILCERPKTRGEQRTKLAAGDPSDGRRSRPRSPVKSTDKRTLETSKQPQARSLMQNAAGENNKNSASKAQLQDTESHLVKRPVYADKSAQASDVEGDLPLKHFPENENQDTEIGSQNNQLPMEEEDSHRRNDSAGKLVEGMINTQENMHNDLKNDTDDLQGPKFGIASSSAIQEGDQANTESKMAPNVFVPRLNLDQVGGHPHHIVENNSEDGSNAVQTSTSNSNMLSSSPVTTCEQSHQKVIAWNDNSDNIGQIQHRIVTQLDQNFAASRGGTAAAVGD
ncbi:hypothetical protein KP509_18G043700 [Ceratopteris richardii]|uniref:Uncharacterized protein n=1 Tax=Ceratopteris richardii TaxID=49495 RepID=A0A8T2SRA9_CERRI|nr:hypothetical protein KP509_18G043700 [Ceratopteris richardii]